MTTPIVTTHAYVHKPESTDPNQNAALNQRPRIDVAIGDEEGVIFMYEDIMSAFVGSTKKNTPTAVMRTAPNICEPRRLHWHRDSVGSVRWSLDGKYFYSRCTRIS